MDEREKQEERNKQIGWITSIAVQLLLLILFYFIVAWKEPFPPIPEYGIELGFVEAPAAPAPTKGQSQIQPSPVSSEPISKLEENESPVIDTSADQSEMESGEPEAAQEVTSLVKEEESALTTEVNDSQKETKQKVDARGVMPGHNEQESNPTTPTGVEEDESTLDQRAIYGKADAQSEESEGVNLALSGWVWDFQPQPNDTSDESGKIIYEIVVDQDGYLVKVEAVLSTVSPSVERTYRQAVEKLTFSKTADYTTAPVSKGTITFIIKSR